MNLVAVLITGLFAGGISCAAVQGGLLTGLITRQQAARPATTDSRAAQSNPPSPDDADGESRSWRGQLGDDLAPVSGFLAGKLAAYTLLGGLLGALGGVVQLSPDGADLAADRSRAAHHHLRSGPARRPRIPPDRGRTTRILDAAGPQPRTIAGSTRTRPAWRRDGPAALRCHVVDGGARPGLGIAVAGCGDHGRLRHRHQPAVRHPRLRRPQGRHPVARPPRRRHRGRRHRDRPLHPQRRPRTRRITAGGQQDPRDASPAPPPRTPPPPPSPTDTRKS